MHVRYPVTQNKIKISEYFTQGLLKHITCEYILLTGFPDSSVGKESTCNAGDPGSIGWEDLLEKG